MMILGFIFQIIILCILIKIFVITIGRRAGVFRSEGWVIITAIIIAVVLNIVPEILRPPIELNPYVRHAEIMGDWSSSQRKLNLTQHLFTMESADSTTSGKWILDDWNLKLFTKDDSYEYLRVIKYGDDYRLLIDSKGKMADMYSYGHAFVRD